MTSLGLAWQNLCHHRVRTAIAAVGVGFAVLLIFMQLGFYSSVKRTATMLFDHLRFDLVVASSEHQDLTRMRDFPRGRLTQARAVPGVAAVTPLTIGAGAWRNPNVPSSGWSAPAAEPGSGSSIFMIAVPPGELARVFRTGPDRGVFATPAAAEAAGRRLARLDTVLLDRASRPEFGGYEYFRDLPATEIGPRVNGRQVDVTGEFELGSGFSWKGMLITGEETFARVSYRPADKVTLGLVELAPGADPAAVRAGIERVLPADTQVFTREEVTGIETTYWVEGNTLGQLLWAGALLAVVVGVIFLYQMMSTDIRNQLSEYATAKALGCEPRYLSGVVLWQAVILAGVGYVPGLAAAAGLYRLARAEAGLPMALDPIEATVVLFLAVGMCVGSGLLAVRKVHAAEPANLF